MNVAASADQGASSPSGLSAEAVDGCIDLVWIAPSGLDPEEVSNYSVYRGTSPDEMSFLTNVTSNVTAFNDSDVDFGDSYYYFVTAWVGLNESLPSNAVVVTVPQEVDTNNESLLPVLSIVVAVIAMQLSVVTIWVLIKKGLK